MRRSFKKILVVTFFGLVLILGSYYVFDNLAAREETILNPDAQAGTKIEKKIFGYSQKQRAIEGYEIGNGEESYFMLGSIHGNEMGTAELLNRLIEEIRAKPDLVSKTKRVIIIPIANPDGYYDREDKFNANGVNLNLNFGTSDWRQYGSEGNFAGSQPFSESESRVIRQVVDQYQPDAMIAFHSQGALVSPEAGEASINLAKWYANATGYNYFDEWDYVGTATQWFVETMGKPAITVELTEHLKSDWEINKEALLELISG